MIEIAGKQIKTALLAYGMSGKIFHAPFLSAHTGFELVGIVERHQKLAVKDYPAIQSYNSVEEVMADPSVELVVVNTPNNLHYEHATLALTKGKHILVEKPVCTTVAELDALYALADRVGKKILFYQNRRWDSDFTSCRTVIETGELGHLHEVHIRYDRYKPTIGPKQFKETPIVGSGLQFDLGPHILDQAISLFGRPEKYYKRLTKLRKDTKVDDFFSIHLSYKDNLEVFLTSSMLTVGELPGFSLFGDKGSYFKKRTDIQEQQLLAGMNVLDPAFGHETGESGHIVLAAEETGIVDTSYLKAGPSNYLRLFDAVYLAIADSQPFAVTREQIRIQIEILSAAPN